MDRNAATQAWATTESAPADMPQIVGGGLIVEAEPNGIGRKVWMVAAGQGAYLLRGKVCGESEIRLGELYWEINPNSSAIVAMIFDSAVLNTALPFVPQICTIEVLRVDGARTERSSVEINPWGPSAGVVKLQIGGEGVVGGRYQITTTKLPPDAVVILGRNVMGKVDTTPLGSVVTFPDGTYLPPAGPTTLSVCSGGKCSSTVFERKVEVAPPNNGKG